MNSRVGLSHFLDQVRARRIRPAALVIIIGAMIFAVTLASKMGAYGGGSDSSGYLNQAHMLRKGIVRVPLRTLPGLPPDETTPWWFIPLGFVPSGVSAMTPTYPIGLPLLVAATSCVTGWTAAPHVTMWLHALAGVAMVFALGRALGLGVNLAAFGALLLATSPLYLFMAPTLMSDVPALVWTTLAVLCAWRSRSRLRWAVAAGAAMATAVLIRPTNALALAPIAIAIGADWRRWGALAAGALPGALVFAAYNHATYGHPLVTGYGSMWTNFSAGWWQISFGHYAKWLPVALTPVIGLALGLPWIASNRGGAVLGTWVVVFGGFYAFYSFTHEAWWYLRFVLPAFPPLIVAALLVAQKLAAAPWFTRWSHGAPIGWTIGVGLALAWSLKWDGKLGVFQNSRDQRSYLEATTWARAHLPADTIVLAMETSGAFYCYTDFILIRWDQLQPRHAAVIERVTIQQGRPVVAALFAYEQEEVLRQRLPGSWEKIWANRNVTFWQRRIAPR